MLLALFSRPIARVSRYAVALLTTAAAALAGTPSAADGFDPNSDGNIFAVATQADGKIVVGGQFSVLRNSNLFGLVRNNIARYASQGTLDDGFDPNANGPVRAVVVQPDGKIVIAGDFTQLQPNGGAAVSRARIARLNPDGSLDASFNANIGMALTGVLQLQPQVFALALQADGKIVVGGNFKVVQGTGMAAPLERHYIVRFNPDGSLDTAYHPNPNSMVLALALHVDGKIVVGGGFQRFNPNANPVATTRNRIARLNPDGTVDSEFDPNADNGVTSLAVQRDGKIILGGYFTTLQPINNPVRPLGTDGYQKLLDLFTTLFPTKEIQTPQGQADFNTWSAGILADYGVTSWENLPANFANKYTLGAQAYQRLIDLFNITFPDQNISTPAGNAAFNTWVLQVFAQFGVSRWEDLPIDFGVRYVKDGTAPLPPTGAAPADRSHVARLNADGTLDPNFVVNTSGSVQAVGVHPDGGVVVGGTFTQVWTRGSAITTMNNLVKFNPDGTIDQAFNPALNYTVNALAFQSDGRTIAGGAFTHAQPAGTTTAISRNRLARINADGTLDATFELDQGGRPLVELVQADGKIIIAGSFTSVGGVTRNYMARLNADGTLDPSYNPNLDGRVFGMVAAPDNKVLIAGAFTYVGGNFRDRLARLNPDGTVDSEFHPEFNGGDLGALAVQPDGKILVGGSFTQIKPTGAKEPRTDRPYFVRLNPDGSLDESFYPAPNSKIAVFQLQPDGKILVGGDFLAFVPGGSAKDTNGDGISDTPTNNPTFLRFSFARINADGTVDKDFNPSVSGQVSAIALQSDGKVVVGGIFTSLQPQDPLATDIPKRGRIARFNADGTLDTTYDPNLNGPVISLAIQSDGKVIAGGSFTTAQPNGATDWTLRKYAARFNTDGTVDPTFNLDLSEQTGNRVDSLKIQPDGKILIGGSFKSLQPVGSPQRVERKYLARINPNGSLDTGFEADAAGSTGGQIKALAVQSDSRVIAVGNFSDLGGAKSTNIARFTPEGPPDPNFSAAAATDGTINTVALRPNGRLLPAVVRGLGWFNNDGTLRAGFNPASAAAIVGDVFAVAREADGSLLVAGSFVNPASSTNKNLIRLSPAGVLDTDFQPSTNASISDIAVQPDGKIIIVGAFTNVNGSEKNRIARLNHNGSLDDSYVPNANGRVSQVLLLSDGKVIVVGNFSGFIPPGEAAAKSQPYIARLNPDGTLDAAFATIPDGPVHAIATEDDGKYIIGGEFTIIQSNSLTYIQTRNHIARLNPDGTLDMNFDPNVNGAVNAIGVNSNSQVVFGGAFSIVQPNGSTAGVTRNNIARVNFDGSLDQSFDPNANGAVTTLTVQRDDSILFGGVFTTLQPAGTPVPITRNHLARVNNTGAVDFAFNPDVNGDVFDVDLFADGSVFVGGNFTGLQPTGAIAIGGAFASVGGVPARNLALLNDNGSVSSSFQPKPDGQVNTLLALPDGRLVVGGAFANVAGAARNRLARFNADNTLDASFNPNANGDVYALAQQPDGKLIVGGAFTTISGQARARLVRLNADGTVDGSFASPTLTGAVRAVAVQADGRILIISEGSGVRHILSRLNANGSADGTFASLLSGSASFNAITLQTDGRIVVGGDFTSLGGAAIANAVRLNPDGTIDTSFNPKPDGSVTAVAVQPDGRVVIGGGFTKVDELNRVGIARLQPTTPAMQALGVTPDRTTALWNRSGSGGELAATIFELSLDRKNWTQLGFGSRVPGTANWQVTGLSLPATGLFYIRARGVAPSSAGVGSGFFELMREFNYSNPVVATSSSTLTTIEMPPSSFSAPTAGGIDNFSGMTSGRVQMVVPGQGTVEILGASEAEASGASQAHLVNLSTRGRVTAEQPLILGFAVVGTESRGLLLRAVGPGLNGFQVPGALAATRLELYDNDGQLMNTNQGWADAPALAQVAARTGAFPLVNGSADSALLVNLAPGNYTIHVLDPRGSGGVALAEIYDAGSGPGARLVNVSTLGAAGQGGDALISGFIIAGGTAERVLLRGVGPGLQDFDVRSPVVDPSIAIYDAQGQSYGGNDNWVSSVTTVSDAAANSGAFALDPGSKDAAVVATLPAGAYTVQVSAGAQPGGTGSQGSAALLEIYEVQK